MWKLEKIDILLCCSSQWFADEMVVASPFSSLEQATSFARNLWFRESHIKSWLNAFSTHSDIEVAGSYAPSYIKGLGQWGLWYHYKFGFPFITSTDKTLAQQILGEVKARYHNSLVVELENASQEKFKCIESDLERLWKRLSRDKIQETTEELGEIVPDSLENEGVDTGDNSEEVNSAGWESILSYDLNKTPEEKYNPYLGLHPEERMEWLSALRKQQQ